MPRRRSCLRPWLLPAVLAAPLVLLAGCAATTHKLDGAWECVDPAPASPELREIKVITDGHFAFGVPNPGRPELYAGGGTCTYDGRQYVEHITYHWVKALVGRTIAFDCQLKDDLWYHAATFDLDGQPTTIREVWRRAGTGAELPPPPAGAGK